MKTATITSNGPPRGSLSTPVPSSNEMKTNLTKKERALLRSVFPPKHYKVLLGLFKHAFRKKTENPGFLLCGLNWEFIKEKEVYDFILDCSAHLLSSVVNIREVTTFAPIPASLTSHLRELELSLLRKQYD